MPKVSKKQMTELSDLLAAIQAAAATPVANGHTPSVTTAADGTLAINWPDPRPASFTITADAFEQLVTLVNARTKTVIAARDLFAKLGTLGETLGVPPTV